MDSFTEPLVGEGLLYSLHQLGCKMPPFAGLCTRMLHRTVSRWGQCNIRNSLTLLPWVNIRSRSRRSRSKLLHARYLHVVDGPTCRQEACQFLLDPLHFALDPPLCDIKSRKRGSSIFEGEQGMERTRYREPFGIEGEFGRVIRAFGRDRYDLRSELVS